MHVLPVCLCICLSVCLWVFKWMGEEKSVMNDVVLGFCAGVIHYFVTSWVIYLHVYFERNIGSDPICRVCCVLSSSFVVC